MHNQNLVFPLAFSVMLKHAVWIIILLDTITFKHRPSNLVTVQIKNKSAPTNPFCIGFLSGTRGAEQLREQKKGVRETEEATERERERVREAK